MKPRIVILSAFLTPFRSGAEACAEEVPLQLADQFDFTIVTARLRRDLPRNDVLRVCSGGSRTSATNAIPVIRIGIGHSIDKWLYPFLAPFVVIKIKPDVVHAILETFAGLALMFCKAPKKILTLQTTNRSFLKGMIVRSPDRVTAISKHLKGIAEELGRKDIVVIPNGIDYAAIRSVCEKNPKVPGRILFVGRLEKMKGVDLLLKAFVQLQITDCRLQIVGDGSQRESLKNLTQELGVADRVSFKGYLSAPEVYREYAEAEIFCGLSRSEALGNVFIEAQVAGCMVVATNIGGIGEIVQDGETGVLVPSEDAEEASHVIQKILSDRARCSVIAQKSIASAKAFDWLGIANRYAEVYKA
ncbi:MAG: glycosyl transferase, group 1 [Candidatus Peregrinibacteria bacterium Greene0416_62]|nr:MAG: glycosyl transferase, group 1 [Candidatus Peregrinibacteria bacterium Greene0416_62]TSC98912.1 MAG: glycosyl transferase, group 1 [Candidatus Peregrinibacteria bacterium Greene1014_49]